MRTKEEKFILNLLKGGNQTKAYQEVYKCSEKAAASSASRMLKKEKIKTLYKEKLAELQQIDTLELSERKRLLAKIALDDNAKNSDRIKAVDTLNRIDDIYNETAKQDTTINITLPDSIKELSE